MTTPETVNSIMADHVNKNAPDGWTVDHLDADSCPSQGWGDAPSGLRWHFRNRHGRWTFAVGTADEDKGRYIALDFAVWKFEGEGEMLIAVEIIEIVLDCMRSTPEVYR